MAARKKTKTRPNPRRTAPPEDVNVNYEQLKIRCGKPRCRCNTTDQAQWHGPYWYAFWNDAKTGKKRSFYVGKHFAPPQAPPRPGAHSERRAPPDEAARGGQAPYDEPPSARRHAHEEPRQAPPPRGSRFEHAAQVLGLSLAATQAEAKKAYRRLAVENHPDRHKGAERFRREELMKQINAAWDLYQRWRGWK